MDGWIPFFTETKGGASSGGMAGVGRGGFIICLPLKNRLAPCEKPPFEKSSVPPHEKSRVLAMKTHMRPLLVRPLLVKNVFLQKEQPWPPHEKCLPFDPPLLSEVCVATATFVAVATGFWGTSVD